MKTYKLFFSFVFVFFSMTSLFAQTVKKETIKVNGECGMCKKKIEKAAKANGAALANWNADTKILQVSYNPGKTSSDKIQKAIADAGYDTEKYSATDDAYNQLDECCKYDRKQVKETAKAGDEKKCCDMDKCGKEKDACKDMACCKDKEMKCCKQEEHNN
ncbi:MAG: cation transporter [Sphingobacteriales bacterium]